MILAGGLSTRLYPLTKQVPKPLVPIALEPNAVHVMRYLASFGYDEIAINVHYLSGAIVDRLGDGSPYGVRLHYLHEEELLGSAGAVKQMEKFLTDDPFVVVGCDDLTDVPLDVLVNFHRRRRALATIALVERDAVAQYGVVGTDGAGRITGFQEKPAAGTERSKLVNTGIYVFSPRIFEHVPAQAFYDFGKDVFPALQQAGEAFFGFESRDAYWCDIGTIPEYWRATRDVLNGKFCIPGTRATGSDESAAISPEARIEGAVLIGAQASVEAGAVVVGPTLLSRGVHVGVGARVEESVLWEGAHVGAGASLERSIAGINYRIASGVRLKDAIVANEAAPVA